MVAVSVITPSYNYGRFIEDAIKSVLGQIGIGVEHIIQDGGSDDETLHLLRTYDGAILWRSEPDRGQADALNRALQRARGRWIAWLNADEFYLPKSLVRLVEEGEREGADVVYGDCVFGDEAGRLVRLVPQHRFSHFCLATYGPYIPSCAAIFRREVLADEPWDPQLRRVMDWDLYLRLSGHGARFLHVAYPAAVFRLHDARVTARPAREFASEHQLITLRYRLPARYKRWAGRWIHRLFKLTNGSYQRQIAAHALRGKDLRWFESESALGIVSDLLRRGYRTSAAKTGSSTANAS